MAANTLVKICGISTQIARDAVVDAGADFIGFTFFAKSPRNVSPAEAKALADGIPEEVRRVALTVNPSDALIEEITAALGSARGSALFQLHGAETPNRCQEIKDRFGVQVMKAVGIQDQLDVETARSYAKVCDLLLLDAKPPKDATRPGGNAVTFDWSLVAGLDLGVPWLLAGGLTPDTVGDAIVATDCPGVDVSSGVEGPDRRKDPDRIHAFVRAAKAG